MKSRVKGACVGEGEIPLDSLLNNIQIGEDITKPAIKMTKQQENECIAIQRKLLNYLLNRRELTEIRDLPFSLKKYLKVLRHWIKYILRYFPTFDRIIKGTYADIKLRAVEIGFSKNQFFK